MNKDPISTPTSFPLLCKAEDDPTWPPDLVSVAQAVLEEFEIPYTGGRGGTLRHVDLKRVDAVSAIKASLLESLADTGGDFLELVINSDGEAEFIDIGSSSANLNPYYTIESTKTTPAKAGVMVTGGKPRIVRQISDWKDLVGANVDGCHRFDATNLSSACLSPEFKTNVVFTFKDPHLENIGNKSWGNGVTDFFEVESPFERIIGFVWDINPGPDVPDTVDIHMQNQTSIPLLVTPSVGNYTIGDTVDFPQLGTLKRRGVVDPTGSVPEECWSTTGEPVSCDEALKIDLSPFDFITRDSESSLTLNKFMGVSNVYIVGVPLTFCFGKPKPGEQRHQPTESNTELWVSSLPELGATKLYRVNEGVDYVIGYDPDDLDSNPCIKFANNSRQNDHAKFGSEVTFKIDPNDAALVEIFNAETSGEGSVLPMGTQGILVEQVWAQVDINTPCFIVHDPKGRANEVADNLTVKLAALSIVEDPSPIAYNGDLINQEELQADNDPTTKQDFSETEMELALEDMSTGRSFSMNLASLNEDQTIEMSQALYDLLMEDDGYAYTHVCPPTDEPNLGEQGPNGGVVNSIEYSYSDQGSYLITVTEGPKFVGDVGGIGGGIYTKKVQDITANGIIIYDYGNHVNYKVRVDGIGVIEAINTCARVLTTRDRVSVTIHNNEVEE